MTVKINYAIITFAIHSDWLKNLVPVFQLVKSTTTTNRNLYTVFPALSEQVTHNF